MLPGSTIDLDEETIGLITDVLENCSYVCLKKQLIGLLSVSELNHLLTELIQGDRTSRVGIRSA